MIKKILLLFLILGLSYTVELTEAEKMTYAFYQTREQQARVEELRSSLESLSKVLQNLKNLNQEAEDDQPSRVLQQEAVAPANETITGEITNFLNGNTTSPLFLYPEQTIAAISLKIQIAQLEEALKNATIVWQQQVIYNFNALP